MKQDKHRFLRKRPGRKPGKAGSSLALVMMIGAALVIWVMCIMPLMTTTGTTAIQTEEKYDDYLESRSSIEYCKSELENIVKSEIPYNFCVIKDPANNDKFKAIRRNAKGTDSLDLEYDQYIDTSLATGLTDATKDKPEDNADGNQVTAICVVEWVNAENHYKITIKTYHNGEPGQTYSLIYTLSGSLLIYPESYKQNQALPLSDFVVVDGIMGGKYNEAGELVANKIWKSTINMGNAVSDSGTGGFSEELLPWVMEPSADYANSQEYPAVFKKTAEAASTDEGGGDHGDVFTDGDFTNEVWIEPTANGNQGRIWIETSNGTISVKLDGDDITDKCNIYLNGEECKDKKVPDREGYYSVTIDYEGTGEYNSNAVNVLPVSGLYVDTIHVGGSGKARELNAESTIESVVKVDGENETTYTVTLKSADSDILYGYSSSDNSTSVTWGKSNVFAGLSGNKDYFFFICRPAKMDNGVYYPDSEVGYVGMIYPKKLETKLEDGNKYLVLGGSDYAMTSTLGAKNITSYVQSDFIIDNSDSGIGALSWTASQSDNEWRFKNNGNNQSITMTGSYDLNNRLQRQWNLSLGTAGQNDDTGLFTVKFGDNETDATVTRQIYDTYFDLKKWKDVEVTTSGYLTYSSKDNRFAATTTSSTVSFLRIPTAPDATGVNQPTEDYTPTRWKATFDEDIMTLVKTDIQPKVEDIVTLYANGSPVLRQTDGKYILAAGEYSLAADIVVDGIQYCVSLGDLTVNKYTFRSGYPMAVCTTDSGDEMTVHVSRTVGHDIGSKYWFGYRVKDSGNAFTWFPATSEDGPSRSFRLKPGSTYEFAVKECGTMNYNSCVSDVCAEWQVTPIPVTLEPTTAQLASFRYELTNEGEPVWYELPTATSTLDGADVQIYPYRVHLVFGADDDNGGKTWGVPYDPKTVRFYGVTIDGSNYDSTFFQISPPLGTDNIGGHTTSMMRGESLYFMGQGASINTYGNRINLTTDLLVLNHDINNVYTDDAGNEHVGSVYVAPYSTGENTPGNTLLFAVNDIQIGDTAVFKEKTFYIIPKDTNIAGLSAESVANLISYHIDETDKTIPTDVQYFFRQEVYPELNLDIAYANDKQLAHILSSETIGWTEGGSLENSDTRSSNAAYVVCAYVNEIKGSISCTANRVLIAAKATDGSRTLNVPADLTVTTRYLSIDADQVVQGTNGVKYTIYNLGQDENFFTWLGGITGLTPYHSKTLQIDFERNTSILAGGNTSSVERQICRIDNETDLFANPTIQPLMVTYEASEVNGWYNSLSTAAKTVDRYVALKGNGTSKAINIGSVFTSTLDIYTNYLYIDDSVESISAAGFLDNDIIIRSQESGYSDKEYLGLFTEHSTESYNGTLVYFAKDVPFTYSVTKWWGFIPYLYNETVTISKGFYYVYSLDGGTSLKTLATDLFTGNNLDDNTEKKPFKVDSNSLKDYSIYIDKDGNISNAYVDTGLFDNTSTGLGGFSGGNVG